MDWHLELNDMPFDAIKSGKKNRETRTKVSHNMTPYEEMKPGDRIIFTRKTDKEKMICEILGVRHYPDVASMFDAEGQDNCMSYDAPRDEAIASYNQLRGYTDGIKEYGIWAIEVKPLDDSSVDSLEFYKTQGKITDPKEYVYLLDNLPRDIIELCGVVHGVITHRNESELYGLELTEVRKQEGETRYVTKILKRIVEYDSNPLTTKRPPEKRFSGTCRDFAILLCAILRHQGVPARLRCGFAAYFTTDFYDDHWVCEYWNEKESRWVLVDPEIDEIYEKEYHFTVDIHDLPRDQFLVGEQAWKACNEGKLDPEKCGVLSIGIKGKWFVLNDTVRDLASLNKIEVLPWDEWGLADKKFEELNEEDLKLIDKIAEATSSETEDFSKIRELFQDERVKTPKIIKSHTTYNGLQMVTLDI